MRLRCLSVTVTSGELYEARGGYLHGIIDAHASCDRASWRVDEELDVLHRHSTACVNTQCFWGLMHPRMSLASQTSCVLAR